MTTAELLAVQLLLWTRKDGSELRAASSLEEAQASMGVNWMEWRELAESIPPAYTEFIGRQLMSHLSPTKETSSDVSELSS